MRRAKLHHFVPQFYLRQWCDSTGKLWVYPMDGKKAFRASPRQFAAETNLYTPKEGAEAVRHDTETWMSGWESHFAKVWPDIVDRCDNPRTRANVARFIGTLIARHPASQDHVREINRFFQRAAIGHSVDADLTFLSRAGEAKLKASEIRAFALTDPDSVRTDFIRLMPYVSKVTAEALMSRRWLALVATAPSFITSDNPFVHLRGSCWRPKYGLGTPGTVINFSVSPWRFLVLADEWERTFSHASVRDPEVFVRRIVSAATRFVFAANPDDSIAAAIKDANRSNQVATSTYSVVDEGIGAAIPSARRPLR